MTLSWDDLGQLARDALSNRAELINQAGLDSTDEQVDHQLLEQFKTSLGPSVKTGQTGVWSRVIVHDIVNNSTQEVRDRGYTVLGTLEVIRKSGVTASSLNSARLDWILSSFAEKHKCTRTAAEMTSRYFMYYLGSVSEKMLKDEVFRILVNIYGLVRSWSQNFDANHLTFNESRITNKGVMQAVRVDLVVAVGLAMATDLGGRGMSTMQALQCSSSVGSELLPKYVHMGNMSRELKVSRVKIELEWPNEAGLGITCRCNTIVGLFITEPIVYNSGLGAATRDYVGAPDFNTKWVTMILPPGAIRTTPVERMTIGRDGSVT